jgi:AraC family transcriptional regulator
MKPQIKTIEDVDVLYVRKTGYKNGHFNHAAKEAFGELCRFIEENRIWPQLGECLGICPDDPDIVRLEDCRYDGGFFIKPGQTVKTGGDVKVQKLAGGKYAIFMHKGPYALLPQTWAQTYRDWLPASGEQLRDEMPFEVYLDDPEKTREEELRTEIWIPIK